MEPADGGAGNRHRVIVGKVSGIYGVSGWVKLISYTRPRENLFNYPSWLLGEGEDWEPRKFIQGKSHGKGLIAKLGGLDDRDAARSCIGKDIAVYRSQMPELPEGEYYWCDLIGLEVRNTDGFVLGKVMELRETGANDVLIVSGRGRHLIPFILGRYVLDIDLAEARMTVEWEPGD